ncbi:hypothetical protein [Endozoicomonas sp. Mp262]|uniref:hypothetical protein n=1 Tax=Endozoicomonas sp. Mp262 TaxID=2919499 RepID=UPI0021D87566
MTIAVADPKINKTSATEFTPDPDKFSLGGLYTDISDSNAKETTIYANGNMQSRIYIAYSYDDYDIDDNDPDVLAALDQYVKDNIKFYRLDSSNNLTELSGWQPSASSNEFQHDLDYAESSSAGLKSVSGRRVPYYLLPPKGDYGLEYRLAAKLGGTDEQTSVDAPVYVHTKEFYIESGDFDIKDVKSIHDGSNVLRSLCYKSNGPNALPDSHKPMKLEANKGIKVKCLANGYNTNCWISMMHSKKGKKAAIFLEHNSGHVAVLEPNYAFYYDHNGVSGHSDTVVGGGSPWDTTTELVGSDVHDGIAMCKATSVELHSGGYHFDFEMQDFVILDNYGNRMRVNFNWDYKGDWYHYWAVSSAKVELPE